MFIALHAYVEQADAAPTEHTYEVFDYLDRQLIQYLRQWNDILKTDVPAFNAAAHDRDVPLLGLPVSRVSEH